MKPLILFFLLFFSLQLTAQKIIYSEKISEDNSEINFEILGKISDKYVVYKNVRWKHMLAVYDENMQLIDNGRIAFMPDKTFNIDFVVYPDFFYMVYQYQKKNVIWCKAVKMSSEGKKLSEPVTLDTSRIGLVADKKIYNTVFSEDKKKILVYKMMRKNEKLTIVTKLYDSELSLLDSTRQTLPFNDRRDVYSDIFVDNNGAFLFAKEQKTGWQDNVIGLEIVVRRPQSDTVNLFEVPLQGNFIDEVKIRIDNLNRNYIINSLFSKKRDGNIEGLFTTLIDSDVLKGGKSAFNIFSDSLRLLVNSGGQYSNAFDNLFLRNTFVKKDGSFIITAEDYSYQAINTPNVYRRYNSLYNSPYSSNYDYYLNSSSYNRYYRPYSSGYMRMFRYYYDDIIILSVDSSLHLNWNTIIHKTQEADDQDNFLSFATMNAGSEIHFLFTDSRKNQLVNNHSIYPTGQMKRYATLKSYEAGYEFMPKLSKQVGPSQVIMPCIYRGSITFAKIDFSE